MTRIFKDDSHQAFFDQHGYLKIQLLDAADVLALKARYESLHPNPEEGFSTSINAGDTAQKLQIRSAIYGTLLPPASALLMDYKPLIGSFLTKRSGPAGQLDFHQDWTFVRESEGFVSLNVWCPLVATDHRNGNLEVIPGTHKLPRQHRTAPRSAFPYADHRELYAPHARAIPTAAGEAIIYDNALFHGSPANTTDELRLVAGLMMIPARADGILCCATDDGQVEEYLADDAFYLNQNPLLERSAHTLGRYPGATPIDYRQALADLLGDYVEPKPAQQAPAGSQQPWWRRWWS